MDIIGMTKNQHELIAEQINGAFRLTSKKADQCGCPCCGQIMTGKSLLRHIDGEHVNREIFEHLSKFVKKRLNRPGHCRWRAKENRRKSDIPKGKRTPERAAVDKSREGKSFLDSDSTKSPGNITGPEKRRRRP